MDSVKQFIQLKLPQYLSTLPIPETFEKAKQLTHDEWAQLAPFLCVGLSLLLILFNVLFTDPSGYWYVYD